VHTVGRLRLGHVELAQSEVAERNVRTEVDEDVLRLEVAEGVVESDRFKRDNDRQKREPNR